MADNIAQFENPVKGIAPNSAGEEAYTRMGYRAGRFFHEMGEETGQDVKNLGDAYVAHQTQEEITKGQLATSTGELNFNLQREKLGVSAALNPDGTPRTNADGSAILEVASPDYAIKVQQAAQAYINAQAENFKTPGGKAWFSRYAEGFLRSQSDKALADMSHAIGEQRVKDEQSTTVTMGQNAQADPVDYQRNMQLAVTSHSPTANAPHLEGMEPVEVSTSSSELQLQRQQAVAQGTMSGFAGRLRTAVATGDAPRAKALEDAMRTAAADDTLKPYLKEGFNIDDAVDAAKREGDREYKVNQEGAKTALETQGKGAAAALDARVQAQLRPGATPDPSLAADVNAFSAGPYASLLPGESASLQAGLTRLSLPEERRKLIPDNTPTATAMIRSLGTAAAPTDAAVSQAQYSGAISDHDAEVVRAGLKVAADPASKQAIEGLHRAQATAAAAIARANPGSPYTGAIISQMRSDSQVTFNQWATTEGADGALAIMQDGNNKRNFFANTLPDYIRAAQQGGANPIGFLKGQGDYETFVHQTYGGVISPIAGPTSPAPQGATLSPADREAKIKAILGHD